MLTFATSRGRGVNTYQIWKRIREKVRLYDKVAINNYPNSKVANNNSAVGEVANNNYPNSGEEEEG